MLRNSRAGCHAQEQQQVLSVQHQQMACSKLLQHDGISVPSPCRARAQHGRRNSCINNI